MVKRFSSQPFNAQEDTGVPFHRNFHSILRRDQQKNSYERRTYESVDEKCLSLLGYVPKNDEKKNLVHKGLIISKTFK